MSIMDRIALVRRRISDACQKTGRRPEDVKLLLATKTIPAETINEVMASERLLIGENRLQELRQKFPFIRENSLGIHFIGHLQTNKVKEVLQYADCIQSVDSIKLAYAIDKQMKALGKSIDIMIQVNTSYEESKFGVMPEL